MDPPMEDAGPSGIDDDVEDIPREAQEAVFTCKFPSCTRQYASTDGVRKHCRKSHPEWLREVDLEKANHGCRWAAYCTRETITESNDPRTTPVGSKRAREMMAQGGMLPPTASDFFGGLKSSSTTAATAAPSLSTNSPGKSIDGKVAALAPPHAPKPLEAKESKVAHNALHGVAMDGKSALVPLCPFPSAAERTFSDKKMPPEMIALPGELSSPLPTNVSALTPNAEARHRLGEIADSESACLRGGGMATFPSSPRCDATLQSQVKDMNSCGANSFFVQWGMPPLKRGMSLADTREQIVQQHVLAALQNQQAEHEEGGSTLDTPSFLDSVLA